MNPTVERLHRKYTSLDRAKSERLKKLQEIAEYLHPERASFFGSYSQSAEDRIKIFDSTPEDSLENLAAALHAFFFSPVHNWFGVGIVGEDEAESESVKEWIEQVEDKMMAKFNDEEGGFHTAIHEFLMDYPAFGIADFFVDNPEGNTIRFMCESVANIRICENSKGRVDTRFREFEWDARQIMEVWPKTCSDAVKKAYEKEDYASKFKIIHVIEPRKNFQKPGVDKQGNPIIIPPKKMAIASYYYEERSKALLEEGGYHEQAHMNPRWAKHAKDPWGRGIGQKALPDIRVLNQIEEDSLVAGNKQADPTTLLPHDGFIGNWDSSGGALNFHRGTGDIREKVMTIGSDADINAFTAKSDRKKDSIRRMFLNDKFMPSDKEMTATEYVGTSEAYMRVLGPVGARLKTEMQGPLINRVFRIMLRNGEIDPPPAELVENGKELKIKYISPVERAQRQIEAQSFTQAMGYLQPLAAGIPGIGEAMARHLDTDAIVRNTQSIFGYPAKNLKSLERIKREDAARAEAMKQQQEVADTAQNLELKKMAKESKPNEEARTK